MSKKNTRDKIVSHTASKVIIKVDRVKEVFSEKDLSVFNSLLNKLEQYNVGLSK